MQRSAVRAAFLASNATVSFTPVALAAQEGLVEEEHVQGDNQGDHHRGYSGGQAVVDQPSHEAPVAAEDQERYKREGDAEREHDLAKDQRVAGVDPYGEDRQGRSHR